MLQCVAVSCGAIREGFPCISIIIELVSAQLLMCALESELKMCCSVVQCRAASCSVSQCDSRNISVYIAINLSSDLDIDICVAQTVARIVAV